MCQDRDLGPAVVGQDEPDLAHQLVHGEHVVVVDARGERHDLQGDDAHAAATKTILAVKVFEEAGVSRYALPEAMDEEDGSSAASGVRSVEVR